MPYAAQYFAAQPTSAPKIRPVTSIGAYALVIIASGMLTSNPTIAPDTAKWNGSETLVARKPMANRLKNASN